MKKAGGSHSNGVIYVNNNLKTKVRNPMTELGVSKKMREFK